MRYLLILSMACLINMLPELASAQRNHSAHRHHHHHSHRGHSYSRYYGRTWANPGWSVGGRSGNVSFNFSFPGSSYYGNPYGPYFYNRFGYYSTDAFIAGNPVLFSGGYSLNGFYPILPGLGYSPPAVYPYSNVPGTLPTLPNTTPLNAPGPAASNIPLNNALNEDVARWNGQNYLPKPSRKIQRHIIPSTRHARELSLRNQVKGDEYFKKQDYRRAYDRYKLAASLTKDIATPHFKKGFALVALKQYKRAAFEFKQGLILDPSWPVTGESLTALYGVDNVIAKDSLLHQVAEWVKEDIRDPERLFVFGVVLHFNGQVEQATDVIRTAARLAGRGDHFLAFLDPQPVVGEKQMIPEKGSQSGFVVDPKKTRGAAFESKKGQPQKTPLNPSGSAPVSKPLTLPPPPTKKLPVINNQALPPLPKAADAAGAPLIPAPEAAKSQLPPLLVHPK
ncbi:MAG: hypothetical protein K0U86_00110 [Planctomycetes bacterium]|nr:hypothetical protein [Planctomycetota bacterium]MCH9723289.1 hypothetical protein [Planctomycetota bacterium]MCH9777978.1 hypothetical protein [Planctomycetota bacterium]MCH9789905.1 hypothetical protein [Planctomycetota bacterium]